MSVDLQELTKNMKLHKGVRLLSGDQAGDLHSTIVGRISTGWTLLDVALGGGIPLGRVIELYGKESSGKSTLALQMIASAQAEGGVGILLDPEMTFSPQIATAAGADVSEIIIPTSETLALDGKESTFNFLCDLLESIRKQLPSPAPIIVVWDTLAATPTEGEILGDPNKSGGMYRARVIREGLRRLSYVIATTHSTLLLINHVHEVVSQNGGWGGPKFATPGGMAPKFHASARIHMRSGAQIKDESTGEKISRGQVVYAVLDKSKLGPPRGQVATRLYFGESFNDAWGLFDYLKDEGFIKVSGPWHRIEEPREIKFYEKNFLTMLGENPDIYPLLKEKATEIYLAKRVF